MDVIEAMRAFAAVAEVGSFTGAGRRLGISTKQASVRVSALERRLAAQLLNRTTRSVALTDAGHAYLARCRPLLDQFDELEDIARERHTALAGPIRVTAPTGFGGARLPPALAPFLTAHPDVRIDLRLTDRRVALVEEAYDLAIRIGALRDSTLIARRLAAMPLVVAAAPGYLAAKGRPARPEDLTFHECLIDANQADANAWRFGDAAVPVAGAFRSNAPSAIAAMAVAGHGVARCPLYAVEAMLADGRLERLFADDLSPDYGLYALYPPNRHLTARVRALIDHLATTFGGRADRLSRPAP